LMLLTKLEQRLWNQHLQRQQCHDISSIGISANDIASNVTAKDVILLNIVL
jgi:hypothetical protein